MSGGEKKQAYLQKLAKLFDEYTKLLVVSADNVGSNQFQKIRIALRGKGTIVMGKNTIMRKAIRGCLEAHPDLEVLLPWVKGNIGFVMTSGDLSSIRNIINENKSTAAARVGIIAPNDVIIEAGPTGLEPTKTSFLQALNIQSKISKGQVDIAKDVHLIKEGQKVGNSEATLLQMLKIEPFRFGLKVLTVYDEGDVYDPSVLDIDQQELLENFGKALGNVSALSLATNTPTLASVPHTIIQGYKNVLSVGFGTNYSFPALEKMKNAASSVPAKAAPPAKGKDAPKEDKKKEEPKKEEKEEEEEEDMGFGLFD
jgi:large subunit ribosomal protein LP0